LISNNVFIKQIIISLISLVFIGCQGSAYQWFDGTFEEAKSVADSKLILLDFYTYT